MTPVERLQAAIEKLEQHAEETWLRDGAPAARGWESFTATVSASNPGGGRQVTGPLYNSDADLIVTLHRTIDAQLAILRFGVKRQEAVDWLIRAANRPPGLQTQAAELELALADAILGSDS